VAYMDNLWRIATQHFDGVGDNTTLCAGLDNNTGFPIPPGCDPFDGYKLALGNGPAVFDNTSQFKQMEANFSLFFALAVQMYEQLLIPDDTAADRFFDANPNAGHGIGEPGHQAVLFPTLVPDLLDDGLLNNSALSAADPAYISPLTLVPGFGPDELFGFDLFAGGNLTAALAQSQAVDPVSLINRNPIRTIAVPFGTPTDNILIAVGSNPFTRSAKCMLCHLGPEQTDHSINISHGLLKNGPESEFPTPPFAIDTDCIFGVDPVVSALLGTPTCVVPAPEPSGAFTAVGGLILSEELEGAAQDAVEVEPRNFATLDDPLTPWDDSVVAQPGQFAFGDQGIYNIGLRPTREDVGRGGNDPFGRPLSLSALTLKNIGGENFEPCDGPADNCVMANFDPADIVGGVILPDNTVTQGFDITGGFDLAGNPLTYPGTTYTLQSINPGFERDPRDPQMPAYMAHWMHSLPAGELHPQIDEMAGMVPNTLTPPNGGPGIEFPEIVFGADLQCGFYNPAVFGTGPPSFGWGPADNTVGVCPNFQSGVANNFAFDSQGTWPVPNRVLRDGAFKAPQLRNVEMTGPYFHTGSYLTLRQVVDFYMRGGDFPVTNSEDRDPNITDIDVQAFAFGSTADPFLFRLFDCSAGAPDIPGVTPETCGNFPFLTGTFGDGLPDTAFRYDLYPFDNVLATPTPEPSFASRDIALEDAKNAIVKFLLSLIDPRVKFERAPFDRSEMFVPVDGLAPDNIGGREALAADVRFRHIAAVGAAGRFLEDGVTPDPLPNFLGVLSRPCTPADGPGCVSHFDSVTS